TIGSGDSMVAGFLYGFAHGKEAEVEALRWGTACGSASAFCDHLAGRSEIEAVLGRVRVTRW
ncbi:MAG: PfkB family carbohydrate kinase, partial [Sphaerochaetaceae bacterium]|nr:PfkB family carbohydrate kinase [Sphaerochaetaceae bacterium]